MKFNSLIAISALFTSLFSYGTDHNTSNEWRTLDVNKTVLLTLPHGKVVIELAPQFSPQHVAQFIKLTKAGHYNGNKFYRVIDGFVAQGGPENGSQEEKLVPLLTMEGDFTTSEKWQFTNVQDHD